MLYDAFICHASEDKAALVRPLAERLRAEQGEGKVSETSDRASATEPTDPVANAATRSTILGVTRTATWLFVAATTG